MSVEKILNTKLARKLMAEAGYSEEEIEENRDMLKEFAQLNEPDVEPVKDVSSEKKMILKTLEDLRIVLYGDMPPLDQKQFDEEFEFEFVDLKTCIGEIVLGMTAFERTALQQIENVMDHMMESEYTLESRQQDIDHLERIVHRTIRWMERRGLI